jgi:hypothetical protein
MHRIKETGLPERRRAEAARSWLVQKLATRHASHLEMPLVRLKENAALENARARSERGEQRKNAAVLIAAGLRNDRASLMIAEYQAHA